MLTGDASDPGSAGSVQSQREAWSGLNQGGAS
jgi:hypothetical protein